MIFSTILNVIISYGPATLAFIVLFSALVLVHEWGHFKAARSFGIQVEEFGIGLPPRAKTLFKDKRGTLYSLNWIPFGGFVRMFGEDSEKKEARHDSKSFASKSLWQRAVVIVAGVAMNFVLAWVLITIGFTIGMKPFLVNPDDFKAGVEQGIVTETGSALYVQGVLAGSTAETAGLKTGDVVTHIDGIVLSTLDHFRDLIKPNTTYNFEILREEQELYLSVPTSAEGKMGFEFALAPTYEIKEVRYPFYVAPVKAIREVGRLSFLTLKMFGNVITTLVRHFAVPEGVSGPVGIAKMTYYFTQQGVMPFLQFAALLSISLGVINVMPFPALDGGRLLFIVVEAVTRRRPNARWESIIHSIGFVFLLLLIVVITWNDIAKLLT